MGEAVGGIGGWGEKSGACFCYTEFAEGGFCYTEFTEVGRHVVHTPYLSIYMS